MSAHAVVDAPRIPVPGQKGCKPPTSTDLVPYSGALVDGDVSSDDEERRPSKYAKYRERRQDTVFTAAIVGGVLRRQGNEKGGPLTTWQVDLLAKHLNSEYSTRIILRRNRAVDGKPARGYPELRADIISAWPSDVGDITVGSM